MSAFTDFTNLLRLRVNIYHNAKVCGDWIIDEHTLGATCFHVVTTGRCLLNVPGHLQTEFNTGDLVIFPRELKHQMSALDQQKGEQQHLDYSSPLSGTGMLCGEVSVLHLYQNQLLEALPAVLLIRNDENTAWLGRLVTLIVEESLEHAEKNSVILNRLSELLFNYALRHYLQNNNPETGILALYANKQLAKAVTAFHKAPDQKWDLASLAQQAGMSRTVFAERFKQCSGWTVNQYTNWWRMQIAWEKLCQGDKVGVVALQIGYQSEAAFSRAFQKQFDVSAGQVRRTKGMIEKTTEL